MQRKTERLTHPDPKLMKAIRGLLLFNTISMVTISTGCLVGAGVFFYLFGFRTSEPYFLGAAFVVIGGLTFLVYRDVKQSMACLIRGDYH